MLVPYLRSSSLNQFKSCEMKYTLEYLFGMRSASGKKALLGTIFHRCFELRGLGGRAKRNKLLVFEDTDFGQFLTNDALDLQANLDYCFEHYKTTDKHIDLTESDKKTVMKWMVNTLKDYPQYDPSNLNIINTEQYFDIEIKEPWAKYTGKIDGQEISGQLRIKGTMDTIIEHSLTTWEMLDYKTGQHRSDFATGEEKTLEYMKSDVQLLLYLIALKTLWPDKDFILTLFYINNGGMFSVHGDDEMLGRAYKMLEDSFKKISDTFNPKQLDKYHRDWRCKYCCSFSKPNEESGGLSACQFYKKEIDQYGLQVVMDRKLDISSFGLYGSGGGRKDVEEKKEA